MFNAEYVQAAQPLHYVAHHLNEHGQQQGIRLELEVGGKRLMLRGEGNGPIDAAVQALHLPLVVQSYEERALGLGSGARAVAMVELAMEGMPATTFGVGIDPNIVTASIRAIVSGANRLLARAEATERETLLKGLQAKLKAVA